MLADPKKYHFWDKIILMEEVKLEKKLSRQKTDDGTIFKIKVQPGAGKNEIVRVQGDASKIKINAPPAKGKANRALIDFLADKLGVKRSKVEIISRRTSRIKKIKVVGEGTRTKDNIQDLPGISTPDDRRR